GRSPDAETGSRFRRFESHQALMRRRLERWRIAASIGFLFVSALPPVVSYFYYSKDFIQNPEAYRLTLDWKTGLPEFEWLTVPEAVTEQMRYTEANRFSAGESPFWTLQGYSFFWEDGRISSFTAVHRPEN